MRLVERAGVRLQIGGEFLEVLWREVLPCCDDQRKRCDHADRKRSRTARSRRAAARRSYRSSLRNSGSTRRMASADRSGSCDGIVAEASMGFGRMTLLGSSAWRKRMFGVREINSGGGG